MRIVLHAGLHKSATTLTQSFWGQVWDEPGPTWYPRRPRQPAGHSWLFRPHLRAFTAQDDPDLVIDSLTAAPDEQALAQVVAEAVGHGVETLVLSSEDLARLQPADLPGILDALGPHDLTVLVTATRPVHRWCATWQTLVRRGLHENPRDAAAAIERVAALRPGRLESLVTAWPGARVVVRLVETPAQEPDLPRDLAALVGLPKIPTTPLGLRPNASLGTDIEVLRRVNAAGQALGWERGGAQRVLDLRGEGFTYRSFTDRDDEFDLSPTAWEAAEAEHRFLGALRPGDRVELHDPRALLDRWLDPTVPDWYATITRREAVLPDLEATTDRGDQLWRARQESAAYQALLASSEQRVRTLRRRLRAAQGDDVPNPTPG